jgi:VanZ family protein
MPVALLSRLDPWLPPVVLMALIFFLSSQPDLNSGLGLIDTIGRKLIHAGEYALLCFLWWRAFATRAPGRRAVALALLATIGYAASDEYHQSFVSGRSGSPVDVVIDALGAGAAALALALRRPTLARKARS